MIMAETGWGQACWPLSAKAQGLVRVRLISQTHQQEIGSELKQLKLEPELMCDIDATAGGLTRCATMPTMEEFDLLHFQCLQEINGGCQRSSDY